MTGDWPSVPRDEALFQLRAAAPERSLHPTKHVLPVRAFRWRWWLTDAGTPAPSGYAPTQGRAWSRAHKAATRIHRERTEAQR
jgi:hypothetical protein